MEEGELRLNLLTQMMEDCQILNKTTSDDAYGGYNVVWTDGAKFKAAIAKNGSPEVLVAEQQGITEQFTVVVQEGISLDYHDVFKRLSDNAIFRVTSQTKDATAHPASTVRIAVVTAERWVLPT